MKFDQNLIKITNAENGDVRYFTKDSYACQYIGCAPITLNQIKSGKSAGKYKRYKYEVTDGSMILWKDINRI